MTVRVLCSMDGCDARAVTVVKSVALCRSHSDELTDLMQEEGLHHGSISRDQIVRLLGQPRALIKAPRDHKR